MAMRCPKLLAAPRAEKFVDNLDTDFSAEQKEKISSQRKGWGEVQNCAVSLNSNKNVTDVCKLGVCLLLYFYLKLTLNFLNQN